MAPAVVITCSALMREITAITRANGWAHLQVECISAELHSRPEKITAAVKRLIDVAKGRGQMVFVAYGDCGTGGQLDALLHAEGVERIPGAHCYQFFSSTFPSALLDWLFIRGVREKDLGQVGVVVEFMLT